MEPIPILYQKLMRKWVSDFVINFARMLLLILLKIMNWKNFGV